MYGLLVGWRDPSIDTGSKLKTSGRSALPLRYWLNCLPLCSFYEQFYTLSVPLWFEFPDVLVPLSNISIVSIILFAVVLKFLEQRWNISSFLVVLVISVCILGQISKMCSCVSLHILHFLQFSTTIFLDVWFPFQLFIRTLALKIVPA